MTATNYGVFAPIVATVLTGTAAIGTIAFTWRGKIESWQPPQQVLHQGPRKAVTALSFVGIAICWLNIDQNNWRIAQYYAVWLTVAFVVLFLLYYAILDWRVFEMLVPDARGRPIRERIVGGFWLTPAAKQLVAGGQSEKAILHASAGELDAIWSRASLTLAKTALVMLFLSCMATGTVTITCWAVIILAKARSH